MRSFRFDPYLWVHLTGIAAVPIFLELCVIGLAIGEPLFPLWFELLFVGSIGILPILWMQWQRPFSIFSLLMLAVKPTQLTDDQRRILSLFKTPVSRILALLTAMFMGWVLWQLYEVAPSVAPGIDWLPTARGAGLVIAAVAFLGSNLFVQVPVSVLRVLFSSVNQFAAIEPYPANQVAKDFSVAGIRVAKILPPLVSAPSMAAPATAPSTATPSPQSSQATEPIAPKSSTSPAAATTLVSPDLLVPDLLEEEWEEEEENSSTVDAVASVPEPALSQQPIAQNQDFEEIELTESETVPDSLFEETDTADGDEVFDAIAVAKVEGEPQPESGQPVESGQSIEDGLIAEVVDEIVDELTDGTTVETIAIEAEIVTHQPLEALEEIVDLTEEILIPEGVTVEGMMIKTEQVEQDEAADGVLTEIVVQLEVQPTEAEIAEANADHTEAPDSNIDTDVDRTEMGEVAIVEDETIAESYPADDSISHE